MRTTLLLPALVAMLAAWVPIEAPARAQAPPAQRDNAAQQANTVPPGNVEKGKTLYVERGCWQCHGLAAHGGGIAGPRLAGRLPAWPAFARYVRRPTEEMIPYTEKTLPDAELADIYAWLKAIPPPPPVGSLPQLNRR